MDMNEQEPQAKKAKSRKSGYQLFHMERVREIKNTNERLKHQMAFKLAANDWTALSEHDKEKWNVRAHEDTDTDTSYVAISVVEPLIQLDEHEEDVHSQVTLQCNQCGEAISVIGDICLLCTLMQ